MTPHPAGRIRPLSEQGWAEVARGLPEPLVRFSRAGADKPLRRMFAILGHHPDVLRRWIPFVGALLNGSLPPRVREMVILRTVWLCRADYEWGPHLESAESAGLTDEEIARIVAGPTAPGWDPFERGLLDAADELHHQAHIADSTWKELASRLDDAQIIEVVMLAGNYHVAAFAVNALGMGVEEGYDGIPR